MEEVDIPEEHKALVRKRIETPNENPEQLLDWDQAQDGLWFNQWLSNVAVYS